MFTQIVNSEAVRKLKALIADKYHTELVIRSLVSVHSQPLGRTEAYDHDNNLIIPIWLQNRYLATAEVRDVSNFTEVEKETIASLARLVLEPLFFGWYVDHLNNNISAARKLNPTPCLFIEGKDSYEIMKAASHAHDLSSNWAYLRFKDVVNQDTTVEEIWAMGQITLFVEDLLSLDSNQKLLMLKLLRNQGSEEGPFLILGSTTSLEELESKNLIPGDLCSLFKSQRLSLDLKSQAPSFDEHNFTLI